MPRQPRPLRRTCCDQGAVRESRRTRITSSGLRAMRPWLSHNSFQFLCRVAESAVAQPRVLAAAATVRVPMLFTCAVAVGSPAPPQCDPSVRRTCPSGRVSGASRIPSSDPLWSGSPENARWSRNATRRVVPTNKGRQTTIHMLCGPTGPILAEIHQPSAHATPELSRWCRARRRRGISNKYLPNRYLQIAILERGRQFFRKIIHKLWTVSDSWIIYVARSKVY